VPRRVSSRRAKRRAAWPLVASRVFRNSLRIVLIEALVRWRRELRVFMPALASMTLLLLLGGAVGLLSFAGVSLLGTQTRAAAVLHVYLQDGTQNDVAGLISQLQADPRIQSVKYVSKEEALAQAQAHPGLDQIVSATDSNPFPPSLEITVFQISDMGGVDAKVRQDPHVDAQMPTSYDGDTYRRLGQLVTGIEVVGGAVLAFLAVVACAITATTIRGVAVARREEMRVMWLVGTPSWMVRGPFVVQGAATGIVAGTLAGIFILGLCAAAITTAKQVFIQWLPGVSVEVSLLAALVIAATGAGLGAVSALVEVRRS
jgi:cell division transport system permease protein